MVIGNPKSILLHVF